MLVDKTQLILKKTLDALDIRQKTINNNIANAETPNYKRQYVEFEDQLGQALRSADKNLQKHRLQRLRPTLKTERQTIVRNDKNNVDVEAEMIAMADNSIRYNAVVDQLRQKYGLLRYIINEGK